MTKRRRNKHVTEDELALLVLQDLPRYLSIPEECHHASCTFCRNERKELESLVNALKEGSNRHTTARRAEVGV